MNNAHNKIYKDDLENFIILGIPKRFKDFQWELLETNINKYEIFEMLFENFLKENKVQSCIINCNKLFIELNIPFNNKLGLKYIQKLNCFSYFPEGLVYKITDLTTNKFYIGETINVANFIEGI